MKIDGSSCPICHGKKSISRKPIVTGIVLITIIGTIGVLFMNGTIELNPRYIEKAIQDISVELPPIEQIQTVTKEKINEITTSINTQIDSITNKSEVTTVINSQIDSNQTESEITPEMLAESHKKFLENWESNEKRIPLKIHELINKKRTDHFLKPLSWNPILAQISLAHSTDMATRGYYSHDTPEGHDFTWRYAEMGFECSVLISNYNISGGGENLMYFEGYPYSDAIATQAVKEWMKSPGHKENILTPYFQSEGIGIDISSDGKIYITQDFC